MSPAVQARHFGPMEGATYTLGRMTLAFKNPKGESATAFSVVEALEPAGSGGGDAATSAVRGTLEPRHPFLRLARSDARPQLRGMQHNAFADHGDCFRMSPCGPEPRRTCGGEGANLAHGVQIVPDGFCIAHGRRGHQPAMATRVSSAQRVHFQ